MDKFMKKRTANNIISGLFLAAAVLILQPLTVRAEMRHINKVLAGTPPFEVVKRIVTANDSQLNQDSNKRERFAPYITWLTDPDPRIQPDQILQTPFNNIYTSRNMGSQVAIAAGQLDYGIRHLHTPILLITINSDNQAVKLFLEGYKGLSPAIRSELDHLNLAITKPKGKKNARDRLLDSIEANIDYQVELAVKRYQDRIDLGRLDIIGSVADYRNFYRRGKGRLIIININNEREAAKLRHLPIMKSIKPTLRKLAVGRMRPKGK